MNFLFSWAIGLVVTGLVVVSQTVTAAEEQLNYDRINLNASASAKVENDVLIAVLYFQKEGDDLPALSNEVNTVIGKAVKQSKKVPNVAVQTMGYFSSPVHKKIQLVGWRVRQSIRLESRDTATLTRLIGDLQSKLAVESISYDVSPESRDKVEERLISEAIVAFNQRAKLVTKELGRSKYRLVRMNVNTIGEPIRPMRHRSAPMMADASVKAPTIEAGQQTIQVTIQGAIELQVE
jgi:predicted secreted protein